MLKQRAVGAFGNPNDINFWSNIPYYFLKAGKDLGFLHLGLPADPKQLRWQKLLWNLAAPWRGDRFGGFQYTLQANQSLFQQIDTSNIGEIISHFQLFPPYKLCQARGISFSHYIDFPLSCLFEDYEIAKTIGSTIAKEAIAREQEQYNASKYVICMSQWAAEQVIERYKIPKQKVHTIIPGANLPESAFKTLNSRNCLDINELDDPPDGKKKPLRIAFVGKAARRKGLDRLATAVQILKQRNYQVIVRAIGTSQNLFPHVPAIEHVGFINKLYEPLRLISELNSCHIGALLSYQEAFGIAALEYLRCGLPALLTKTGGLSKSIPTNSSIFLPVDCTGLDIADCFETLLNNPEQFQQLRYNAHLNSTYASWNRAIKDFQTLWNEGKN